MQTDTYYYHAGIKRDLAVVTLKTGKTVTLARNGRREYYALNIDLVSPEEGTVVIARFLRYHNRVMTSSIRVTYPEWKRCGLGNLVLSHAKRNHASFFKRVRLPAVIWPSPARSNNHHDEYIRFMDRFFEIMPPHGHIVHYSGNAPESKEVKRFIEEDSFSGYAYRTLFGKVEVQKVEVVCNLQILVIFRRL